MGDDEDTILLVVQNIEGRDLQRGKAHAGISPRVKIYLNDFLIYRTKIMHGQSPKWEDERIEYDMHESIKWEEERKLTVDDFHSELRFEVFNHKTFYNDEFVGQVTVDLSQWKIHQLRKGQELDLNLSSMPDDTAAGAGAIMFKISLIGLGIIIGANEQMERAFDPNEEENRDADEEAIHIKQGSAWKILNRTQVIDKPKDLSASELSAMMCKITESISIGAIELWDPSSRRNSLKSKQPSKEKTSRELDQMKCTVNSLEELSNRLQVTKLEFKNPDEQAAFWLNIYHSLLVHSVMVSGFEPYDIQNSSHPFFMDCYLISGLRFSAADIRFGVLRCNQPCTQQPFIHARFSIGDPRRDICLDPIAHGRRLGSFMLYTRPTTMKIPPGGVGAQQVRPLPYSKKSLDSSLEEACHAILEHNVHFSHHTLQLPELFNEFYHDFAETGGREKLLTWVYSNFPKDKNDREKEKVHSQLKELLKGAIQHPKVGGSLNDEGGQSSSVKIEYAKWERQCYLPFQMQKSMEESGKWFLDKKIFYNLLVAKDMLVAKSLFLCLGASANDRLENYGKLAEYLSVVLPIADFCSLLCYRIQYEIRLTSKEKSHNLFRNGSAATKTFLQFGKKTCKEFVQRVILKCIAKVIEITKKKKIDDDDDGPIRHANISERLPVAFSPVTEVVKVLLEDVINSVAYFPPLLRRVCCTMQEAIQENFPGDSHLANMPVGFVMLRLISPAIIDPISYIPTSKNVFDPDPSLLKPVRVKKNEVGVGSGRSSLSARIKTGLCRKAESTNSTNLGRARNSEPCIALSDIPKSSHGHSASEISVMPSDDEILMNSVDLDQISTDVSQPDWSSQDSLVEYITSNKRVLEEVRSKSILVYLSRILQSIFNKQEANADLEGYIPKVKSYIDQVLKLVDTYTIPVKWEERSLPVVSGGNVTSRLQLIHALAEVHLPNLRKTHLNEANKGSCDMATEKEIEEMFDVGLSQFPLFSY